MRIFRAILLLALLILGASPAGAQNVLQKLISPGPLTAKHAQFEGKCEACHSSFDKSAQSRLCADCHKAVTSDIAAHKGFHGRFAAASAPCQTCHVDHAGRDKNIINFNTRSFNHDLTDYPLRGKHATLACATCHVAGRKFRDAPVQCAACHGGNDPHKGSLGSNCASCHSESGWKETKFDHDTTKFPLTGAHAAVQCQSCHADQKFSGTPQECVSCHGKDDAHHGSLGPNCASCHNTANWKNGRFDHSATSFPLTGKHVSVRCEACHAAPAGKVLLPTACEACHKKDDVHKGSFGPNCASCHTTSSWKATSFDHARTAFPLVGKHADTACTDCHISPPAQKKLATDCISCHARDDRHEGQLGANCEQCHNETTWKKDVKFDHEFAPFALIGKHASVECTACHANARFKDAGTTCIDCHRKDDRHRGVLGPKCETCHNSSDWTRWTFDHDAQTSFPLTGAHAALKCASCHREPEKKLPSICVDCHRADDIHQGGFGPGCDRCHTTATFRSPRTRF